LENKKNDIIILLGFDVETDCGSWSPFYEGVKKGTPLLLSLLDTKKVKGTFFFTGEAAKLHPEICRSVLDNGHEIGCHSLLHETVGDPIYEIPGIKPLLPSEVKGRLETATAWVTEASGKKPISFRCPRLWGSTSVVNALEELGYVSDASYPMYFYEKQLVPYHPDSKNWLEKGELNIVEIPNFADMTIKSNDEYKRDRDQWPKFRTEGAGKLMVHINNFINMVTSQGLPAVICFYFHPWEFVKLPDKFRFAEGVVIPDNYLIKNCGDYAVKQLDILIDSLKDKGAVFKTAEEIYKDYKW